MEFGYLLIVIAVFAFQYGSIDAECICPYNYDPVCGINGKTYPNECVLNCDGIPMAYPGECIHDLPCACPLIYQPVCGEDGRTYGNLCALQCKKIRLAHYGECQKCYAKAACAVHPCHTKCRLFPFAVCVPGCFCDSRYFINGVEVTKLCNIPLRRLRRMLD